MVRLIPIGLTLPGFSTLAGLEEESSFSFFCQENLSRDNCSLPGTHYHDLLAIPKKLISTD
jgi:hypothetical protein